MNSQKLLRSCVSLLVGSSVAAMAAPALAQGAPAATGGQLEEIVVTAQKREQNLQVVPIAISALSATKIDQLNIRDSRDLSGLAPNVTVTQGTTSMAAAVISIRGITTPAAESFGLDTANALYVDGVYIARSAASALDVSDIERIEVLRGPQGTLFGRNTTGGAIAFISRAPSKEFHVKAQAGFGNYDARNAKITVDSGAIGNLTTSFSYAHSQRNGVVDNILQPDKFLDPGSRKSDSFRAAARYEFGNSGSIQYIFDSSKVQGSPLNFQLTNTADGTLRPNQNVDGKDVVVTQQAPVAQYLAAASFLDTSCIALAKPQRTWRNQVCNDVNSYSTDRIWGHNLQIQDEIDGVKVKFTGGHREWRNKPISDLDGIGAFKGPLFTSATLLNGLPQSLLSLIQPASAAYLAAQPVPTVQQNLYDTQNDRRQKQTSAELEFSSQNNYVDWVVGGFWFKESGSEYSQQNSGYIYDTSSIFLSKFGPLGPSLAAANPARFRMVQTKSVLVYTADADSSAIYSQATFYPGGRDGKLRLTAGGRYTWDNKSMVRTQNGPAPLTAAETGQAKFSRFTWNLMAGYDLTDDINLYARAATGFRSGGFNSGDPVVTGTTTLSSFAAENVTSYEIGLKSELFDRKLRFNVAGYHNIYNNLAVSIPQANSGTGTFTTRVANAGKVTYTGIELEGQAVLSENFSIDGNLGYVDIKYKEFLAGQPTTGTAPVNIASIVTPGYTSPFTANIALNAQFPLNMDNARLTGRVAFTHEDGKYSFNNSISSPFNEAIKGDNRNMVDVQIAVERLSFGGAEGEVRFWGKNITNQHPLVRGIDFGALGYAGGYFADPATYGVTFGLKF
jgi:iron complex outermembrane receptor protein